ncbi:farnesol dehydrogenase-like [Teleopsis dalmanni]|uniref:farnesol dehydrogenase-like n=1 Tax=Teleopsis dalmanni TaxID=139649 RepID=UPI0018CCD43A|nr:farnesol dehydrogenase-like [Teleopsis dalmanni]
MDRWNNRIAVVTGASSGIGAACCKYLVNNGMIVIGLARRKERLDALRNELKEDLRKNFNGIKCDISEESEVIKVFADIEQNHGPVAVLVNNAGIVRRTELLRENNTEDIRSILNTNVMGVVYCTREAFRSMKKHNIDGHVFIVNSIAGHKVLTFPGSSMNMYPPSKFAVTAMTEIYRNEFLLFNTKVKITSISPGAVDTEIISEADRKAFGNMPILRSEDVADAMIYCLQTPSHVQIHELTIKPVGEQF